ncbi:ABC transporter ATP-binding protein [Halanaerobium salsuginis]|jgi:NitT/TauT family transport system ATP-binding protein|uniref:ABC-type quaternary amine transporter n=1 Tax=Halanaerobium salsuginis TaxID=29563 RepID=A0A1I4IJL5_9FIRM|nr:ABC transporter ATP-binding protein [Halanaerobium salsuginis]SFL54465.1 NitT/TauT family transport system ATP-binding protein [Halanaerobium salsuginis]
MIKVENLTFAYQAETVVKEINFELNAGKSLAIIGPSGCGKTTLLYLLAALQKPDSGAVTINGKNLTQIREKTGVILQDYGLFPWKTVYKNLTLGLKIRGYEKYKITKIVGQTLKDLKIEELANNYPAELSGGQKQRVAIGRALVLKPDLLLMDEPFSALDALTREKMQNLILKIHQQQKLSFVIVTHDIAEAVFLGQTIMVMQAGKVIKLIDNQYFGEEKLREKAEFFLLQKKLRQLMQFKTAGDLSYETK